MSKTGQWVFDVMMAEGEAEYKAQQAKAEQAQLVRSVVEMVRERGFNIDRETAADYLYDYGDSPEKAASAYLSDNGRNEAEIRY